MVIFLIALLLALAVATLLTIRRNYRALEKSDQPAIAPLSPAALFTALDEQAQQPDEKANAERAALLDRAAKGELSVLRDARATGDAGLYGEVLGELVERSKGRQEELNALVTLFAKSDELRASIKLAGIVIESWKADPDRRSPIEVLHLAAISDDAATYHLAADAVIDRWRCGLVPRISARELVGLIESHYWLLDPQARSGGDGFRLKRRIKSLSRELIKTTPAS